MKFKIGDRVRLKPNIYQDSFRNPVWEGKQGKQVGKVIELFSFHSLNFSCRVKWKELNSENTYKDEDLELICKEDKNCKLCQYRLKCITM